ncbi:coat protein [Digitaria didactyla striate mosaic virus]|uniref:Capsid protein n=1 Tax=Digitaria didactyla striate mosaic virus TaxID=889510 RepID=E2FER2_9GEMI|nr:coat protein [Digitaria didactyla striate mosaic virus]ADN93258.1 coat protein [Digitaria didactyla striate mosaic virus]
MSPAGSYKRKRSAASSSATPKRRRVYKQAVSRPLSRREPLQVQDFTWEQDSAFNAGGSAYLLTSYARGSAENQRKTAETITYKVAINLGVAISGTMQQYCVSSRPVCWLVYDAAPSGTAVTAQEIFGFPDGLKNWPTTWKVARSVSHRFIVKRRWVFTLESNGSNFATGYSSNPCAIPQSLPVLNKFAKQLGVRTEWKNTAGGDFGDIKSGALYLVLAPANGLTFVARGNIRMYFKSVGNQ